HCVQIQEPFHLFRIDLVKRDVACIDRTSQVSRAPGETRWNDAWARLRNRSSNTELHHLWQLRRWIRDWTRRSVIHHDGPSASKPAEINKHIGKLGGSQHQTPSPHWNIPHAALGADLPEVQTAKVEVQDPRIAAVQYPKTVHARLDIEIWPYLAVDQHNIPEILPDPNRALDIARRVKEFSVSAELAILDHERNFVRAGRNTDRVGLQPGVVLVAKNVGSGQSCKDVEARRAEAVIVEPEKRRGHLWQLIRVMYGLRVARAEAVWRNCGVTVAISVNEAAGQVRYYPHVISKRSQTRVYWNPIRIKFR